MYLELLLMNLLYDNLIAMMVSLQQTRWTENEVCKIIANVPAVTFLNLHVIHLISIL